MSRVDARRTGRAVVWKTLTIVSSRGLTSLRTLILGWMLTRGDFGQLAVAASALELLLSLSNFGFEEALIQMRDPSDEHYRCAWTLRLTRSIGVAAVLVAGGGLVAGWYGQPDAAAVVAVLALRPVLDATMSIRLIELRKRLEFREQAIVGLARGLVDIVVAVSLASSIGVWALVVGQLAGAFVASVVSYVVAPWRPGLSIGRDIRTPLMRFGRWVFVSVAIGTGASTALQVLVSRELGAEDLGALFLAIRLGMLVPNALGMIVDDVGLSLHAANQDALAERGRVFRFTALTTTAALAPIALPVAAVSDRLVPSLLGVEWESAGWPLGLVLIAGLVGLYPDAAGTMFLGVGKPEYRAGLESARFVSTLAVAAVLIGPWRVNGAATALIVGELVLAAMAAVLVNHTTGLGARRVFGPLAVVLAAGTVGASVARACVVWVGSGLGAALGAALGAIVAVGALMPFDARLELGVRRLLESAFPRLAAKAGLT